ncbi:hypothetical protein [Roseovarius salis]|uniref:hypothetical protein n=1 Tax=Roseovarius salis TaxID=3376063 RepID=UPI0037C6ED94
MVNFGTLKQILDLRGFDEGHDMVVLSREGFEWLLRQYVASFPLDEEWYRSANSDVQEAFEAGAIDDAKSHFVTQGYIEGRGYPPADFDEASYLENNDDLRDAYEAGNVSDLKAHFVRHGFYEGRRY